mgnify:CR=1 FL=1
MDLEYVVMIALGGPLKTSNLCLIMDSAPATIVFLGANDNLIPIESAVFFKKVMKKIGNKCELGLYGEGKKPLQLK